VGQDLVFAIRQPRKSFKFSAIVVLTLALGIGAATAIFSLVNGVLLRALPFPRSERLVALETLEFPQPESGAKGTSAGEPNDTSYSDFSDWAKESTSLESIAAYRYGTTLKFTPEGNGLPRIISAEYVSADFFRVLGVGPILGRTFLPEDEGANNQPVILSHTFWATEFGASPKIVGRTITISDRTCTVIGVMPSGFQFPYMTDPPNFWRVFGRGGHYGSPNQTYRRDDRRFLILGRLKAGVSLAQASAELSSIQRGLAQEYPEDRKAQGVAVSPLLNYVTGKVEQPLYLLFAAVTAVLLMACVNVAGLLLARGLTRKSEFAVRIALGAKPWQIVRQVLIESTFLSCCAGVLGVGFAFALLKAFLVFSPLDLPRTGEIGIDGSVLAFSLLTSLATGVGFGVAPAWSAARSDSSLGLWRGGRGISGSRTEHRLHGFFVIAEAAISLVLLASSGLLIRSFVETMRVAPGFDPHHVLTLRLGMSMVEYPQEKTPAFFRQLLPQLAAIPGVQSVSSGYPVWFTYDTSSRFQAEGQPADPVDLPTANRMVVSPTYFETLRLPLLRGRVFDERDDAKAKFVAVVNAEFARTFFPGQDAIGKSIQPDFVDYGAKSAWYQIVGVVGDVRSTDLTASPAPEFFLPYEQAPYWPQGVLLRVTGEPRAYLNSVREVVAKLNRDLPIFDVNTLDELIARSTVYARFEAQLLTCFAVSALLLAAVGLYGALSEMVARRTFEIGLRVALGAQRRDVFRLVVGRGVGLAVFGVVLGLGGFAIAARFVADLLYGVQPSDPGTLIMVSVVLLMVSFAASSIPALRAARLEPTEALRES
jgi:predicted permease